MDDGSPTLEVGFAIDTSGAFANLLRMSEMFDSQTAEIIKQIAQVEKATGGMMRLAPVASWPSA